MDDTTVVARYSPAKAVPQFLVLLAITAIAFYQAWPYIAAHLFDGRDVGWPLYVGVFTCALVLLALARNIRLWHIILRRQARAIWIQNDQLYYCSYVAYTHKNGIPLSQIREVGTSLSKKLRHFLYSSDNFIQLRLENGEMIPIEVGWLNETPDEIISGLNLARLRGYEMHQQQ
ncbi:MAG: hypothetical protein WCD42_08525 [Rhizomicrobium sp.]